MTTSIQVVRRGTAVAIESGSRRELIRARDLAKAIGEIGVGGVLSAQFDDNNPERILIELEGGARESVPRRPSTEPQLVVTGARLMICDSDRDDPLEVLDDGAIIAGGGRILWRGASSELARAPFDTSGCERIDANGRLVSPGLIDCHTHLVFGGSRHDEFAMRARGADYREIAAAGGGIASTRSQTLSASFDDLVAAASTRLRAALQGGTTTLEAKSGYALTVDGELELLEVAGVLDSLGPIEVVPTLLGAHLVPPELAERRRDYVDSVVQRMIPAAAAAGLCTSVDVYCDEGAFTLEETRIILQAAQAHGLDVKAHVGQFADLGGPELLADFGGLSADHLEEISDAGIAALAAKGVVAVMLPAACVQLKQVPPPVAKLRTAGVAMALATDMNPGSSHCETLAVPMWLACTHYGMSVEEAWLGVTLNAARALGRHDIGTITVGAAADLVVWDCEAPGEVPYRIGKPLVSVVVKAGRVVVGQPVDYGSLS